MAINGVPQPLTETSDRDFVFQCFRKNSWKKSILHIVRALWRVREVESYALSKFQPPTTLGDPQNVKKTIQKKFDFFGW